MRGASRWYSIEGFAAGAPRRSSQLTQCLAALAVGEKPASGAAPKISQWPDWRDGRGERCWARASRGARRRCAAKERAVGGRKELSAGLRWGARRWCGIAGLAAGVTWRSSRPAPRRAVSPLPRSPTLERRQGALGWRGLEELRWCSVVELVLSEELVVVRRPGALSYRRAGELSLGMRNRPLVLQRGARRWRGLKVPS